MFHIVNTTMPKGCTHSRNPSTKKCRSKKEHDSKMAAYKRRVAAAAKRKITSSLRAHAMALRKKRKSKAASAYTRTSLKTTRL